MGIYCRIQLHKSPDDHYKPGSLVKGEIIYAFDRETTVNTITTYLIGKAKCEWSNGQTHYEGTEKLYKIKCAVLAEDEEVKHFLPNSYIVPFDFVLPCNIPPSFEDSNAYIKHRVKIKFTFPGIFNFNKVYYTDLNVVGNVTHDEPFGPVIFGCQKKVTQLFPDKGNTINLKIKVQTTIFRNEDNINLDCVVTNDSKLEIYKVKINLWEKKTYKSDSNSKNVKVKKIKCCKASSDSIEEFTIGKFSANITLPKHVCTIQYCKVLKRKYWLMVTAKLPLPHQDAYLKIPITIGETISEKEMSNLADTALSTQKMKFVPEVANIPEQVDDNPPSYWEVMNEDKSKEVQGLATLNDD